MTASEIAIPQAERVQFGALSYKERAGILKWIGVLRDFEAAASKSSALAELKAAGVSQGALYRHRNAYLRGGWRGLLDGRGKALAPILPADFISALWVPLCLANQRKCAPAYRSLFHDHLLANKLIPGYGSDWAGIWRAEHAGFPVPQACPYRPYDSTPRGWSYENLMRYAPDAYQRVAARIGPGAASDLLPKIPTTRKGLRLGQFYVMDDVYHDVRLKFLGNAQAQIAVEMGALELLSGHYCVWGVKPVIERADRTREHLRERYVRYILAHVLCRIGFDEEGVTFLGEHGVSTIRPDSTLWPVLERWGDGRVRFEAGGVHGAPIARGLFEGRPRGNFRFKAALESHHNLKKNEIAQLPGQKGADPEHAPEDQYGRDKEHKALMKACVALAQSRPDLARELRMPYMDYYQFVEALTLLYDRIADRKEHELEGFEEAGLVRSEFRLFDGAPWMPCAALDRMSDRERAAVTALLEAHPERVRIRAMSPLEVFEDRRSRLVRWPDCAVPELLGPELGAVAQVTDRKELAVPDPEIPGKSYTFAAYARNGSEHDLPRRSKWLCHVSPFDDRFCYVSTPDGSFVGVAPALKPACRTDTDAVQRNLGILRHAIKVETDRLAPHAERLLRERYAAAEHNAVALLGANPVQAAKEAEALSGLLSRAGGSPEDLADVDREEASAGDGYPVSMEELSEL